ncbi:hypothetical protein ENUP19_0139G0030 [Entamoeba nuttalli]|uniref:TLDc domain-containing protein n=1 Tax=Entamoeba nuttalli TaxID=412467 RepID=A0ABQ0DK50_9EUKA
MSITPEETTKRTQKLETIRNSMKIKIEEIMKSTKEYNENYEKMLQEETVDVSNENTMSKSKRIEDVHSRKEELTRTNVVIIKQIEEGIEILNQMKEIYEKMNFNGYEDKQILKEQIPVFNEGIEPEEKRVNEMTCLTTKEEILVEINEKELLSSRQIEQIEEWTNRKVGNILFDSNVDDWNVNTSVFGEKIMNKEYLIIVIEDTEGNKFGGYVNSKIGQDYIFITTINSFIFSLESNGRIKGMKKFDIKCVQYGFRLFRESSDWLFAFGSESDIRVWKSKNKILSYCKQSSFGYEDMRNVLCGNEFPKRFTPQRIIVIEMK